MARSPKSVRRLLLDKPTLKFLDREIAAQQALLIELRQCLPTDLGSHCVAARISDHRLTLHADSPVWATRLRYLAPQLLTAMKHAYPRLSEIKVRLRVERHTQPRKTATARKSDVAAAIIHDSAADTKQAPLRDALLRLSHAIRRS